MLQAYLHPKKKPNDRHWYAYDVVFDGEIIITNSRDPEHDLARALLARGIKGNVTLHDAMFAYAMRSGGSSRNSAANLSS
jgi:hypothetical protein